MWLHFLPTACSLSLTFHLPFPCPSPLFLLPLWPVVLLSLRKSSSFFAGFIDAISSYSLFKTKSEESKSSKPCNLVPKNGMTYARILT
ncbi:hypothetical protein LINGRAHAP2_LOCUS4738 [Linum grandiflorum]